MGLIPSPKLTATYEQRQAYIDFLVNKIISETKARRDTSVLEWELAVQIVYRGPEREPPPPPPEASVLDELKLRKFGEPFTPPAVDSDEEVE